MFERVGCRSRAARHVELVEDVADMPCDGLFAELQVVCDRLVRPAGCDEAQHLEFAGRKARGVRRRRFGLMETREIERRAELLECASGCLDLEIGAIPVLERATGLRNQQLRTSGLVGNLELAPERPCRPAGGEGCGWIALGKEDRAVRLRGDRP